MSIDADPPTISGFKPDTSVAEMQELAELSERARGFQLLVYLNVLGDLGAPALRTHVDGSTAVSAGDEIVRFELTEPLLALLAALRAGDIDNHM